MCPPIVDMGSSAPCDPLLGLKAYGPKRRAQCTVPHRVQSKEQIALTGWVYSLLSHVFLVSLSWFNLALSYDLRLLLGQGHSSASFDIWSYLCRCCSLNMSDTEDATDEWVDGSFPIMTKWRRPPLESIVTQYVWCALFFFLVLLLLFRGKRKSVSCFQKSLGSWTVVNRLLVQSDRLDATRHITTSREHKASILCINCMQKWPRACLTPVKCIAIVYILYSYIYTHGDVL